MNILKTKLSKKAQKSSDTWHTSRNTDETFREAIKYGEEWEKHLGGKLPNRFHSYEVKHVSEVLPEGQYRLKNNKYPDFTLTNHATKRMILIDAKRKTGYPPCYPQNREYVTMDETYIESYENIRKHYQDKGFYVEGRIYFFVEMKMDLYVANDFQPHDWKKYNNQYGKEQVGIYYLDQMSKDSKVLNGWIK